MSTILKPPPLDGWTAEPSEPGVRMQRLADVVLTSAWSSKITVLVRPFSPSPQQPRGSLGGFLTSATWLPRTTTWIPVAGQGTCFQSTSLRRSPDPQFAVWGQARCRRDNFVLIFNFAAKEKNPPTWRRVFPRVVARTTTASACLTPEEMTHLADYEGPPFVVRRPDARTVDVAARSMCGSGGCPYWRCRKDGPCFRLVGIVRGSGE